MHHCGAERVMVEQDGSLWSGASHSGAGAGHSGAGAS